MLILPVTCVLGSRCLDLGTVGEGQGRLTGGNGAVRLAGGMAWGRETQLRTRSPLAFSLPRVVATNFLATMGTRSPFLVAIYFLN